MEPRIQYAKTSDGVSIAYCTLGAGPDILIVPALPYSHAQLEWQTFSQFYVELARDFRVTWYDARGSGVSNRDSTDFSMEAMVRDAQAVVNRANVRDLLVAGFGCGNLVAVTLASNWGDRILGLVLVDGYVDFEDIADSPQVQAEALIDKNVDMYLDACARVFFGVEDPQRIVEYLRACIDPEALRSWSATRRQWNVKALLPEIRTRTLVYHTTDNRSIPLDVGRRLAAAIPNARLEVCADGTYEKLPMFIKQFTQSLPGIAINPRVLHPAMTAIILFADIADSTGLTEKLGDAAFREKARELDGALRAGIRERGGTAIEGKLLGDGVLAVFTSARQAIEAALACGAAGSHAGLPLHLGLHAGDVIREEGNVYSGAVNIASRIAGLSAAGEVLVSETVRSLARTSSGVRFEDRGEQALKGVGEPVRIWAVQEGEA